MLSTSICRPSFCGWRSESSLHSCSKTCGYVIVRRSSDISLVVCDESGHTKVPFSVVVLSWGELG